MSSHSTLSEFIMKIMLLLILLSVTGCDSSRVVGLTGQNVTLSCKYDIKSYGALYVCWNLGAIPRRGCDNQLISTDGHKVTERERVSSRFQLLGRLDRGDVSLTIQNLTEKDAGRYGCRVEILGGFNDEKHHFDLTVKEAPDPTTSEPEMTPADQTTGPMTTENRLTSSSQSSNHSADIQQQGSSLMAVLVCVLFLLVALVSAAGLFVIARRWRQLKPPQQQVQMGSTISTMQLHHGGSAVENIYQLDEGADTGDYELCPSPVKLRPL